MIFSAKKLITQSAKQLWYLSTHSVENKPNKLLEEYYWKGGYWQDVVANMLNSSYKPCEKEMGGCYTTDSNDKVYFSHDIVTNDGLLIIETKYLSTVSLQTPKGKQLEKKYLLQCAIYDTLTRFSSPYLNTAKFQIKENNHKASITLSKEYVYKLAIKDSDGIVKVYTVTLINPYPILKYIQDKINASKNYNTAVKFDKIDNEYIKPYLERCFSFQESTL